MIQESHPTERKSRQHLLRELISLARPTDEVLADLRTYQWDSDDLIELQVDDALVILQGLTSGRLSRAEVEKWANAIESREDIALPPEGNLSELIFHFANPVTASSTVSPTVDEWIEGLKGV